MVPMETDETSVGGRVEVLAGRLAGAMPTGSAVGLGRPRSLWFGGTP